MWLVHNLRGFHVRMVFPLHLSFSCHYRLVFFFSLQNCNLDRGVTSTTFLHNFGTLLTGYKEGDVLIFIHFIDLCTLMCRIKEHNCFCMYYFREKNPPSASLVIDFSTLFNYVLIRKILPERLLSSVRLLVVRAIL